MPPPHRPAKSFDSPCSALSASRSQERSITPQPPMPGHRPKPTNRIFSHFAAAERAWQFARRLPPRQNGCGNLPDAFRCGRTGVAVCQTPSAAAEPAWQVAGRLPPRQNGLGRLLDAFRLGRTGLAGCRTLSTRSGLARVPWLRPRPSPNLPDSPARPTSAARVPSEGVEAKAGSKAHVCLPGACFTFGERGTGSRVGAHVCLPGSASPPACRGPASPSANGERGAGVGHTSACRVQPHLLPAGGLLHLRRTGNGEPGRGTRLPAGFSLTPCLPGACFTSCLPGAVALTAPTASLSRTPARPAALRDRSRQTGARLPTWHLL
jgi:hypothetical protein